MYKEVFCKYKNRKVILNEFNMGCVCAHCHQENCNRGASLTTMNDCQERIMLKINYNYKLAKAYRCRLCARMSASVQENEPRHEIIRVRRARIR